MRQTIACTLAALLAACAAEAQTARPAPRQQSASPPAARSDAPVMAEGQARPGLPVVRLIATGGTIAMKIDPVKKAPVPAISGDDLVATVPEIAQVAHMEVENLANVPSAYMDPDRWVQLHKSVAQALARPEVAGVIVSHGTDTLEETGWFLDLTVDSSKPIVLIGAQRNASERDFDGPRNLFNAARSRRTPRTWRPSSRATSATSATPTTTAWSGTGRRSVASTLRCGRSAKASTSPASTSSPCTA